MAGEYKNNRGPATKEEWLEGVLKSFADFQRFQDAELAADDVRQAFQDGLKLEPAPPTVDDLVERRIAQAERVVALYRLWSDTLWPRDLIATVPEDEDDEPPTFQEWLEEQTAAIVKALAIPAELLEASEPPSWSAAREIIKATEKAGQEDEGAAIGFWSKADIAGEESKRWHWFQSDESLSACVGMHCPREDSEIHLAPASPRCLSCLKKWTASKLSALEPEQDAQEDEGAAIDREFQEEKKTPGVSPPGYWSKALRHCGIEETRGFHWWPKGAAGQSACRFHTTPVGRESELPGDPEQRCNHCIECWRAAGGVDSE